VGLGALTCVYEKASVELELLLWDLRGTGTGLGAVVDVDVDVDVAPPPDGRGCPAAAECCC